jgi:AcrR family transcriptional regulator
MLAGNTAVQKMTLQAISSFDLGLTENPPDEKKRANRLRQAERTEATRAALLASAERVFAREGFEAARIEDIALDAGRTRGAFYANFEGKEEIFIALRNITFRRRRMELRDLLANVAAPEEREQVAVLYLLEQIRNSQSVLLQLEFKLFALRHPEMRAELAKRHLEALIPDQMEELPEEFRFDESAPIEQQRRTLAVEALLEGFALNALFSPEVMDGSALAHTVPPLASVLLSDWLRGFRL